MYVHCCSLVDYQHSGMPQQMCFQKSWAGLRLTRVW